MIKAIIFDFFDVIHTDAYKSWLAANGIPYQGPYLDASHQQDIGDITAEQFLERLSELQGRAITRKEMYATAKIDYDVLEVISSLKKNYKLALLSNSPSAIIRKILADYELERYFDEIVISSEVGMVKPSADIFTHTLRSLKVAASEAIFVDDNQKHTKAAEALGIRSIHFRSAKQLKDELGTLQLIR